MEAITTIRMICIVFGQAPTKWRRGKWRVHTGHFERPFQEFATKRLGAEWTARMGRECTQWLRELNEAYRRASQEGQGYVLTMTGAQVTEWNRAKQNFDISLEFLAIRQSAPMPYIMNRLLNMSRQVQSMAALVSGMIKARYTGAATSMRTAARDAELIEAAILAGWKGGQDPGEATGERRLQA
jgi:hypothetical protein